MPEKETNAQQTGAADTHRTGGYAPMGRAVMPSASHAKNRRSASLRVRGASQLLSLQVMMVDRRHPAPCPRLALRPAPTRRTGVRPGTK